MLLSDTEHTAIRGTAHCAAKGSGLMLFGGATGNSVGGTLGSIEKKCDLCNCMQEKESKSGIRVAIIGGGAAGFFAAIRVKERLPHASVDIYNPQNEAFRLSITNRIIS